MDPFRSKNDPETKRDYDQRQRCYTQHKKRMEDHYSKKKTQHYPDLDDIQMDTPNKQNVKMNMETASGPSSAAGLNKDQISKSQQLKEQGNACFRINDFENAIVFFT